MMYGVRGYGLGEPVVYGGYDQDATAEQPLCKSKPKLTGAYEVVSDRQVRKTSKMVYFPQLGKVYTSIGTASRELGFSQGRLSTYLKRDHGRTVIDGYEAVEVSSEQLEL